ncbi:hypothetical protein DFP72DRAFT_915002 [Ephemerocybe angulata]|uniref:Uncharacterized protein n=1 Tax=Ephemerocybe angulata TaxID=980116 RepID=A0A8H6HM35_9AGAR|nr:hypothetical protein DFP72DRAFT_915002 [Tulosesus angulatus]
MESQGRSMSPETPSSPLTRSLDLSSSTIDELTDALSDLTTQEPASAVVCCCGREECENTVSWLAVKSHLESRLILSAGRNEHKRKRSKQLWSGEGREENGEEVSMEERLGQECDQLTREKADLERRLNVALVNNEVTEVSNKTLLQELQEARETISRLTANNARSMGWDSRLTAALKERDDMQQERDSESHRARLAESRFAALKDKTNKLQNEVRRLQEALEEKRQHRLESSESIISEARSRLPMGSTAKAEQDGLTSVLETLVNDNDVLKRDNAELQRLLTESREDLHIMQEEVEEQRANMYPLPRSGPSTPLTRHFQGGSVTSLTLSPHTANRRTFASEASSRNQQTEPLTPDSTRRPLSPLDSFNQPDARWNAFSYPLRRVSPSPQIDYDIDEDANEEDGPDTERVKGHRTLMLLTRSRGVQTEAYPGASPMPSQLTHLSLSTPPDPRSESSSFSESLSSHVSGIFERATHLLNKMTQADALTLTNRLKRQNLKGADLSHLSRTTVSNIVAEAIELRSQFRVLLEDEKTVVTCTRKDLRVLFKLLKDVFMELGQLRVSLNDVIFDPSCAPRVSELALNPSTAVEQKDKENAALAAAPSWIAPISSPVAAWRLLQRAPRLAPKLGPALAASTTTVNVEFSGAGVGRAKTSVAPPVVVTSAPASETQPVAPAPSTSVMNIFAGAPKPQEDPWVVLPRAGPRRVQSTYLNSNANATLGTATLGRSNFKKANRLSMSRNVDAVIDSEQALASVLPEEAEEADFIAPLPEYRTLRRRGLSDSSIHSTEVPGSPGASSPTSPLHAGGHVDTLGVCYDRNSVFQALLRLTTSGAASSVGRPLDPASVSNTQGTSATDMLASQALLGSGSATHASHPRPHLPSTSSSIFGSSGPGSPMVQEPTPIGDDSPQISRTSVLSPQGTPRTSRFRPKSAAASSAASSHPSTPKRSREREVTQHSAGLVGGFLPNLAIGSWIPGGHAADVLDDQASPESLRDPFVVGMSSPGSGNRESFTVRPHRRGARNAEGRASRDFL